MIEKTYDYIIIGAGSAGCVLAERLSRDGRFDVLLLEAGGCDRKFWIKMPLGYAKTYTDPAINWCYRAQPDPGLNGRQMFWPRGRVLGGSSSINAMAYVRGLPHDYDDWSAAGAAGWGWQDVEPGFNALERVELYRPDGTRLKKGRGPVRVAIPGDRAHPFNRSFFAAARDSGWRVVDDLNGLKCEGMSLYPATMHGGRRWSCADAFLRPALRRANLHVVTGADVEKIMLDGRRASAVQYSHSGGSRTAAVGREVIVSAGAVNSPKLLQLSGIGPPELLRSFGITVRHVLNEVGRGLQDHLTISYAFASRIPTLNCRLGTTFGRLLAGAQYLFFNRGPLSMPINQCGGFVRSAQDLSVPDLQIYCNPASYSIPGDGDPRIDRKPGYLLSAQQCRPTSRGAIQIASPNPHHPPAIQPNSLSTNEDCLAAIKASRLIHRLAQSPALRAVTGMPSTPDIATMDDGELLAYFRAHAHSVYHASCTCRMGDDPGTSVLDARLKVHGVAGVRVIDASSFPNVTSGNTNAPTIMLAARGAEMILQDAANNYSA